MVSGGVVPAQALARVLPYLPCARVQRLREVSRAWDEACRQRLRRVFERLLDEVNAKKKSSEAQSLPACHWYPYSIGCVHYCLLVLQSTIESRFGSCSDAATVPGAILDRVKEIFEYIDDIPIAYELPSDEIYDKLRNLYHISFAAVGSLEKMSEKLSAGTKESLSVTPTKQIDCLESNQTPKPTPRGNVCRNLAVALGVRPETRKSEAPPPLQRTTTSDPQESSAKDEQQTCAKQPRRDITSKIDSCAHKDTGPVRIRKLKRPSMKKNDVSTQVDDVTIEGIVSESNNETYKQKIGDLQKEIQNLSNLLKESETRNKESNWKCCTLLSELSCCRDEITQLRSKSTLSSTKNKLQSDNNSLVVGDLRKQISENHRELAEKEEELAKVKKTNIALDRKLAKCERELKSWRDLQQRDSHWTRSETQRITRTCVLQRTIREYGDKLEKSEKKTRNLHKQYEMLVKKIKRLSGHEESVSASMILNLTGDLSSRFVSNRSERDDDNHNDEGSKSNTNPRTKKSPGEDVRGHKHGKRKTEHSEGSIQRLAKRQKTTSSLDIPKELKNLKNERCKVNSSLSSKPSQENSSFFQFDHVVNDVIHSVSQRSVDEMEVKRSETRKMKGFREKRFRAKHYESQVSSPSNTKESAQTLCTNLSFSSKRSRLRNKSFEEEKSIKLKSPSNSKNQSCEKLQCHGKMLNSLHDSCKVQNKSDFTGLCQLSIVNDKMKHSVSLEPVCFGEEAMRRGNLKGFQDARISGYSCPVQNKTNGSKVFQTVKMEKPEETENGNTKLLSVGKHASQVEMTQRGLQVPSQNCQPIKIGNDVQCIERNDGIVVKEDVKKLSQEIGDKNINSMKVFKSHAERCKLKETFKNNRINPPVWVAPPPKKHRKWSSGRLQLLHSMESEGNLKMYSVRRSSCNNKSHSVTRRECPSLSRNIEMQSEELKKLRLNPEIEINVNGEKSHNQLEKNQQEALKPPVVSCSTPCHVTAASLGVPQGSGMRTRSVRRSVDGRTHPARTIRLKERASVTSEAVVAAGPTTEL